MFFWKDSKENEANFFTAKQEQNAIKQQSCSSNEEEDEFYDCQNESYQQAEVQEQQKSNPQYRSSTFKTHHLIKQGAIQNQEKQIQKSKDKNQSKEEQKMTSNNPLDESMYFTVRDSEQVQQQNSNTEKILQKVKEQREFDLMKKIKLKLGASCSTSVLSNQNQDLLGSDAQTQLKLMPVQMKLLGHKHLSTTIQNNQLMERQENEEIQQQRQIYNKKYSAQEVGDYNQFSSLNIIQEESENGTNLRETEQKQPHKLVSHQSFSIKSKASQNFQDLSQSKVSQAQEKDKMQKFFFIASTNGSTLPSNAADQKAQNYGQQQSSNNVNGGGIYALTANQSFASSANSFSLISQVNDRKQSILENYETSLSYKYPQYFQDYSNDNDEVQKAKSELFNNHSPLINPNFNNNNNNDLQQQLELDKQLKNLTVADVVKKNNSQNVSHNKKSALFLNTPPKNLSMFAAPKEKTKLVQKNYSDLNTLVLAQEFQCGNEAIRVIKFRADGEFMAMGGQDGVLRIWKTTQISNNKEVVRQTIDPICFRIFKGVHKKDILDLCWSEKNPNLLLTASADYQVALWNLNIENTPIQIFTHPDIVTSVTFKVGQENLFVSGCFDKFVRIWNIKQRKVVDWKQTSQYITAIGINPVQGVRLVVGLVNGEIHIYDISEEKLNLLKSIHTRQATINLFSKKGKKVTGIEFLNPRMAIVTTNDSRIRIFELKTGRMLYKLKGHKNRNFPIKSSFCSDQSETLICGTEDGEVYVWNGVASAAIANSKRTLFTSSKTGSCEYFQAFGGKLGGTSAAVLANSFVIEKQNKNYERWNIGNGVKTIIVTANFNGLVKIYHNQLPVQ